MMFTGGGRKKAGSGQNNNNSQRSRNRSHQEVSESMLFLGKHKTLIK